MVTLTREQAHVLLAHINAIELCLTGVWPTIEQYMRNEEGIDDPEMTLEDARQALQG
jgi:hypothetical protein